jgi:TP901 family phage tail tape measure protein
MPSSGGYVVPTIFTAVDRLSSVVSRMARNVTSFAGKAQGALSRVNTWSNKLVKGFFGLGGQIWSFARSMLVITGIFGALNFGAESVVEYEKQLAGLHSILSDLTKGQLGAFDKQIKNTARITRESAVDVASAYAQIAERNPDLAKTASGLDAVARSAIMLSKASKGALPLKEAAESLVTIMTQYKFGADQANRVVNTLAAGAKYGSAPIEQSSEAFSRFASVARRANVTLEQSNALVQILGASGFQSSEAGNAIKASITRLQLAGAGYSSGVFKISDALQDVVTKYNKIKTAKGKDKFLFDIFGLHRITQAGELISNLGKFDELTQKLTGTSEAQKAAAINGDTLSESWRRLKNQFANYIISNDGVNKGLAKLRKFLEYVTDNLDSIIDKIITGVTWFIKFKIAIWAAQGAIFAYNVAIGIMGAVTGVANVAIGESTVALTAYRIASALTTTTATGLSASVSTTAASFGVANTAATGFFATLSGFVIPAALIALGGLAIWKVLDGYQSTQEQGRVLEDAKKQTFSKSSVAGRMSRFGNQAQESGYQKWWLKNRQMGVPDSLNNRAEFDDKFGKEYHPTLALDKVPMQTINNNSKVEGSIDVNFNDPQKRIQDLKFTGHNIKPNVRVGTTNGVK